MTSGILPVPGRVANAREVALAVLVVAGQFALCRLELCQGADPEPSVAAYESWIADWQHPEFARRKTASQRLRDAGPAAYPALVLAAVQGNSEVRSRALHLLERGLQSSHEPTQAAARQALEMLAANPATPAGLAARSLTKEKERGRQVAAMWQRLPPMPPGIPAGRAQLPRPPFPAHLDVDALRRQQLLEQQFRQDALRRRPQP